ncbi:MAG: pyridoxal phosphate-dependent aminotransferase [Planctomycetaceae bacterium]|jgi:putative C-S lyase|nr:pyridoxal phosphate-dependent aminotransferase [Planctomycetaceae bacterium]
MSFFDTIIDRRKQGSCKWDHAAAAIGDKDGILALSTADTDFPTAPPIKSALIEAAENHVFGYTNPTGAFYDAVISWMHRRHHCDIQKEWIVCTPGIVSAMYYFLHAFTQKNDGVIIQPPVYAPFASSVRQLGRQVIENPLLYNNGVYQMDFADLERKAALPHAKMMFLCSPHNPAARCWTYEELERTADICTKNHLLLVSDEIHFDFVFPPHHHTVFTALPEKYTQNIAVCTSPSKSFNLAGLQLSNIIIPNRNVRQQFIDGQHRCGSHLLNTFSYIACTAAYQHCGNWFDELRQYIYENDVFVRKYIAEKKLPLSVCPLEATYLQWLDFSQSPYPSADERKHALCRRQHILFENGLVFGKEGEHFERFNIACPRSVVEEVLYRLAALLG